MYFKKLARLLLSMVCPERKQSGQFKTKPRSNAMTTYFSQIAFTTTIIGVVAMFASFTTVL